MKLNLIHILTILAFFGGVNLWYAGLASDIAIAQTDIKNTKNDVVRLEEYLIRIEAKLDRIRK